MSKGSSPRPFSVDNNTFSENFDRIFGKKGTECPSCRSRNWAIEFNFVGGAENFYKVCSDCEHTWDHQGSEV